jgi:hypothetical protein
LYASDIHVKKIHESIELYVRRNQVLNSDEGSDDDEFGTNQPMVPGKNQELLNAMKEREESEAKDAEIKAEED